MVDNTEINVDEFTKAFSELDVDNLEPVEDLQEQKKPAEEKAPAEEEKENKEVTTTEEEENKEVVADENTDSTDGGIYSGIANLVKEEAGLFSSLEIDKIKDATQLVEAIKSEIVEGVEDYKNSLPEVVKNIIANYEDGVPLSDLIAIQSNEMELESITEEDLDNVDLQKNIYTHYLKATTKFTDAKIEKEIAKLEDLDELGDEVKNALEELKELTKADKQRLIEESKKAKEAEEKARVQAIKDLKDNIDKTEEIIQGVKLNQKEQAELYKQMTTPVGYTREGYPISKAQEIRAKDPVAFEKTLNYLIMKGVFSNDHSLFKAVEQKGKTKAISEFEKVAKRAVEAKQNGLPAKSGAAGLAKDILNAL